jgi:anaerobic selenocysteine-containing dehydrogenase
MNIKAFIALFVALIAAVTYGLWFAYQSGWDAHQKLSDAERAATLAQNENVAQSASHALSYDLGQIQIGDASAEQILREIEFYVPSDDAAAVCGIPVDRLRQLEAIK